MGGLRIQSIRLNLAYCKRQASRVRGIGNQNYNQDGSHSADLNDFLNGLGARCREDMEIKLDCLPNPPVAAGSAPAPSLRARRLSLHGRCPSGP
jgi:hypothetical protein